VAAERPKWWHDDRAVDFHSTKGSRFLAVLCREPLSYTVEHQAGSHRKLTSANGYPEIGFSWHDGDTLPGSLIRRYLKRRRSRC
jgi:hypothetical protein